MLQMVAMAAMPQYTPGKVDLVVSHCHESLDWLMGRKQKIYRRIVIYSKCGKNLTTASLPNGSLVVRMENVGSCDGAYLRHIVRFYSDLADFTMFCKATHPRRCGLQTLVGPAADPWSKQTWSTYDSHCHHGFYRFNTRELNRPGHCKPKVVTREDVRNFSSPTYKIRGRRPVEFLDPESLCYYRSGYEDYTAWITAVLGSRMLADRIINAGQGIVLGGYFAAERSSLIRYPRALYEAFSSMQEHANEELDHFIERTWGLLLTASKVVELSSDLKPPQSLRQIPVCSPSCDAGCAHEATHATNSASRSPSLSRALTGLFSWVKTFWLQLRI